MSKVVREPIQVYLTPLERAELDQAAREMGVSRSELLRRGIRAMRDRHYAGSLRDLVHEGLVTPAGSGPGGAPSSAPVTSLSKLLAELEEDRAAR
jgi:transposase-like protein